MRTLPVGYSVKAGFGQGEIFTRSSKDDSSIVYLGLKASKQVDEEGMPRFICSQKYSFLRL